LPANKADDEDTYTRFIAAAERVFAEHGYEGAKIRAIAALAHANLGTLHHYWGSKRALFEDVCRQRLGPISEAQLAGFTAVRERLDRGEPASVRDLIIALLRPAFLLYGEKGLSADLTKRFYSRARMDPSPETESVISAIFADAVAAFLGTLRGLAPDLNAEEFYWRVTCVVGALFYSQGFGHRMAQGLGVDLSALDWEMTVDYVADFLEAGVLAPTRGAKA
jgi:AcrR family transcriptional regulator